MAWMFQWNIHMSCTHVPTHVAKGQASTWLIVVWCGGCELGGLVLALLFLQRESAAHLLAQARSPRLGNTAVGSSSAPEDHSFDWRGQLLARRS